MTPAERRAIGSEAGVGGYDICRDPRRMTPEELRTMGHEPMSATAAIRAHCLDCCAGSPDEVRKCTAFGCPSWPWRMGMNPWRTVSEGRRAAGLRLAAKRAEKSSVAKSDLTATAEKDEAGTTVLAHLSSGPTSGQ